MLPVDGSTLYLTASHADKIQRNAQAISAKCETFRGLSREARDRTSMFQQATAQSLMADMAGGNFSNSVESLSIPDPYAPCTIPADQLRPMSLAELRQDSHHRGQVLLVHREAPVITQTAMSWTVVEDDCGDVERLELHLHISRMGESILESRYQFKIKEPYFSLNSNGEAAIQVHHPSDIICVQDRQSIQPPACSSGSDPEFSRSRAFECKEQGNAALKANDLARSWSSYTEGILRSCGVSESGTSVRRDLYRNRAQANLLLHRYDEAQSDSLASISAVQDKAHRLLDNKGYFRAGCAAYNLRKYDVANEYFLKAIELSSADGPSQVYFRQVERRLSEQLRGDYDFTKMERKLSPYQARVDAASCFTKQVAARTSPRHGKGLFASREIATGELVFCEKAFCSVWKNEPQSWTGIFYDPREEKLRALPAGLEQAVMQKLINNPSTLGEVIDLHSDWPGLSSQAILTEKGPAVDAFQIHDIVARNAFAADSRFSFAGHDGTARNANTGLWVTASYMNHCCVPNTSKSFLGDLMIVRATKPIKTNEEILHSYIDESAPFDDRQMALMNSWHFTCSCPLCFAECTDGPELRGTRERLLRESSSLVEGISPQSAGRVLVTKARCVHKALYATYDLERYTDVPKRGLAELERWLTHAGTKK